MVDRSALLGLAKRQYGLITRTQALNAGFTRHHIDSRLARGSWTAIERGVYLLASHPATWKTSVLAAVLRTEGVASHRTAGVLWDLDGIRAVRPEMTVPFGSKVGSRTAVVHRTKQWDRIEATDRSDIRATGIARTLLDIAWGLSQTQLLIAVDSARLRGLVDYPELYTVYRRHSRQGRTCCGPFRALPDQHLGEKTMSRSGWNRLVQKMLTDAGLPRPELEFQVEGPDGFRADLDLAFPDQHLGIELDSATWHLNRTSFEQDPRRRNQVHNLGWSVLNFTWSDYIERCRDLVATVRTALEQRS